MLPQFDSVNLELLCPCFDLQRWRTYLVHFPIFSQIWLPYNHQQQTIFVMFKCRWDYNFTSFSKIFCVRLYQARLVSWHLGGGEAFMRFSMFKNVSLFKIALVGGVLIKDRLVRKRWIGNWLRFTHRYRTKRSDELSWSYYCSKWEKIFLYCENTMFIIFQLTAPNLSRNVYILYIPLSWQLIALQNAP